MGSYLWSLTRLIRYFQLTCVDLYNMWPVRARIHTSCRETPPSQTGPRLMLSSSRPPQQTSWLYESPPAWEDRWPGYWQWRQTYPQSPALPRSVANIPSAPARYTWGRTGSCFSSGNVLPGGETPRCPLRCYLRLWFVISKRNTEGGAGEQGQIRVQKRKIKYLALPWLTGCDRISIYLPTEPFVAWELQTIQTLRCQQRCSCWDLCNRRTVRSFPPPTAPFSSRSACKHRTQPLSVGSLPFSLFYISKQKFQISQFYRSKTCQSASKTEWQISSRKTNFAIININII